jgi:hypothetical protein
MLETLSLPEPAAPPGPAPPEAASPPLPELPPDAIAPPMPLVGLAPVPVPPRPEIAPPLPGRPLAQPVWCSRPESRSLPAPPPPPAMPRCPSTHPWRPRPLLHQHPLLASLVRGFHDEPNRDRQTHRNRWNRSPFHVAPIKNLSSFFRSRALTVIVVCQLDTRTS